MWLEFITGLQEFDHREGKFVSTAHSLINRKLPEFKALVSFCIYWICKYYKTKNVRYRSGNIMFSRTLHLISR